MIQVVVVAGLIIAAAADGGGQVCDELGNLDVHADLDTGARLETEEAGSDAGSGDFEAGADPYAE